MQSERSDSQTWLDIAHDGEVISPEGDGKDGEAGLTRRA